MPLLAALIFSAAAAAQPSSYEEVWRRARAASERGDLEGAAKMLDEALARAGNSDAEAVWALRVERAIVFVQNGRLDEASKILTRTLPAAVRDSGTGARFVVAQAMLRYFEKTSPRPDRELIDKARKIAAAHAPRVLPEILPLLGGEENVREAVRLARLNHDAILAAKAEASLVYIYGQSGKIAEAIKLGEGLRPRLTSLQLLRTAKTNLGNLGWLYSEIGDYEHAADLLARTADQAAEMHDYNEQLVWLATLSNVLLVRRDWEGAIRRCQQIIAATTATPHRSRGHAFSDLGRAFLELGRLDEARNAVRQALALESGNDALITRIVGARIDMAAGQHDAATKTLKDVIDATTNVAAKLTAYAQLGNAYAQTKKPALAEKSFNTAVGLVRAARADVTSRELRLTVYNTATELFDDYVDFLVAAGRDDDALRVTETSRAETLEEALDVGQTEKLDARKIAAQRNATILCYWLGRRRSYVWTVTGAGVKRTTIARSDTAIEAEAQAYRARLLTIRDGTLQRSAAQGAELYRRLVEPAVAGIARGAQVIVIPDGKLHTLNFETLVVPGPQPRYWIEDVVLSNASSLQLLARPAAPVPKAASMLLVGNPKTADAAFPPLPNAATEIADIQKGFGARAKVLDGPRATPTDYAASKPETFDLIHFVAHGVPNHARPLDSAIILGPDAQRNYRLVARDILSKPLRARLVTISSCHGAGAATYAGEGLVGLAWAFLHAGAQQIVAALWAVDDTAAPELMHDLYAGIRQGKDPAVALRDAKLRLIRSGTSHKHARFWAPFVTYS